MQIETKIGRFNKCLSWSQNYKFYLNFTALGTLDKYICYKASLELSSL